MKQEPLPADFLELVTQARIDVDKHGVSSTTIVIPIKWYQGLIKELSDPPNCGFLAFTRITPDDMWIFGCRLAFGFIDAPIAATDLKPMLRSLLDL